MDLSNLKPVKGATRKKKRIARGVGSGKGGHSSTKGTKGQKSRAGARIPAWFEGGQMPLQRRVPKFGFYNRFRVEYRAVNLSWIARLVDEGRIDSAAEVTPEVLVGAGVARKADRIKILGSGDSPQGLSITAHAFSASARKKIEAAGGKATVLD